MNKGKRQSYDVSKLAAKARDYELALVLEAERRATAFRDFWSRVVSLRLALLMINKQVEELSAVPAVDAEKPGLTQLASPTADLASNDSVRVRSVQLGGIAISAVMQIICARNSNSGGSPRWRHASQCRQRPPQLHGAPLPLPFEAERAAIAAELDRPDRATFTPAAGTGLAPVDAGTDVAHLPVRIPGIRFAMTPAQQSAAMTNLQAFAKHGVTGLAANSRRTMLADWTS